MSRDHEIIETGEAYGLPWVTIQLLWDGERGHMCGYVGVPTDHPCCGVDYSRPVASMVRRAAGAAGVDPVQYAIDHADDYDLCPAGLVEVHGGLTWADDHPSSGPDSRAAWWFGFDACHHGDLRRPDEPERPSGFGIATYKGPSYMRRECERLARQLSEVKP